MNVEKLNEFYKQIAVVRKWEINFKKLRWWSFLKKFKEENEP